MRLFKALFHVVTAPVEVAKDVFTLGGVATQQDKSYTAQRAEQIDEDLSN